MILLNFLVRGSHAAIYFHIICADTFKYILNESITLRILVEFVNTVQVKGKFTVDKVYRLACN